MKTLNHFGRFVLLVFLFLTFKSLGTDVLIDANEWNANPAADRPLTIQPLSPVVGNLFTNVTDDNGQYIYPSAKVGDYVVVIRPQGSSSAITFQFTVTATNLGQVDSLAISSQLGIQSYPTAGKASWTTAASDARYELSGTTLSNTFYPLFSNPSNYTTLIIATNQITNAIPTNFWSSSAAIWISNLVVNYNVSTNKYAFGSLLSSNYAAGVATINALSQTNNFTSIVTSNSSVFANTNQLLNVSNVLAGAIGAAGISSTTATNIAAFQSNLATNVLGTAAYSNSSAFYSANNPSLFMAGSSVTNFGTGLTNTLGTAARSNASAFYLSSNPSGYISGATVTNTVIAGTNGFGNIVLSNASAFLITNQLPGLTNAFVDKNITNNAATRAELNAETNLLVNRNSGLATNLFVTGGTTTNQTLINPILFTDVNGNGADVTNLSSVVVNNGIFVTGLDGNVTFSADGTSATTAYNISQLGGGAGLFLQSVVAGGYFNFQDLIGDGSLLISNGIVYGSGLGLTAIPAAGISTNGSSQTQVLTSFNGKTIWTNAAAGQVTFVQATNIADGQIVSLAITNAFGTNAPVVTVAGGAIFIPTNSAAVSNFLYATKMDETNAESYGQVATNFATEGNVSFGFAGTATNIYSTTNVIKFINSGTSLVTNGSFSWVSLMGVYSNKVNSAILTNNGTAWLMETNGTTLFSLNGASPVGTWTAVAGSGSPLSCFSFQFNHDGMEDTGFLSITNINNTIQSATNGILILITNGTITGSISASNGFGTNTTLGNPTFFFTAANWGYSNKIGNAQSAILSGVSNSITLGADDTISGGRENSIGNTGGSVIAGGESNSVAGGAGFSVISGGLANSIIINGTEDVIAGGNGNSIGLGNSFPTSRSSILGGQFNSVSNPPSNGTLEYSTILGGQSNSTTLSYDVILGGLFATVTNNHVLMWSDGSSVLNSSSDNTVVMLATNGYNFRGGPANFSGGILIGGVPIATTNSSYLVDTNFILNQIYTNTVGTPVLVRGAVVITTAAVAGSSELDLMVDQTQSGTFVAKGSCKLLTSIAAALAGTSQFDISGVVSNNATYYFTNSSAGVGDSSALLTGSGQISKLP